MKILTAKEVNQKLTDESDIILVMVLSEKAFQKAHIPNSLNISDIEVAKEKLPIESKIIVYCSDSACVASYQAYQQLESAGYKNIWRFAGGLLEWNEAGYKLNSNT